MPSPRLPCATHNADQSSPPAPLQEQGASSSSASDQANRIVQTVRTIAAHETRGRGRARRQGALILPYESSLPTLPQDSSSTSNSPRISASLPPNASSMNATKIATLTDKLNLFCYYQKLIGADPFLIQGPAILNLSTQELSYLNENKRKFYTLKINELSCTDGQLQSEHIPRLPSTLKIIDFSKNPNLDISWLWGKVMGYTKPISIDMSGTAWATQLIQECQNNPDAYNQVYARVLASNPNHDGLTFNIAEFTVLYQMSPDNFPSLSGIFHHLAEAYRLGQKINLDIQIRFASPENAQELPILNTLQLR